MILTLAKSHQDVDLMISTVSLSHTPENLVKLFRCTNCGSAISQYQGLVVKIYPIVEPSITVLVINKCPECGQLYTFQTQDMNSPRSTRVILFAPAWTQSPQTFRCHVCRSNLIKFTKDKIFDTVNQKVVDLPYTLECPEPTCKAKYYFPEIV